MDAGKIVRSFQTTNPQMPTHDIVLPETNSCTAMFEQNVDLQVRSRSPLGAYSVNICGREEWQLDGVQDFRIPETPAVRTVTLTVGGVSIWIGP
jgi:hypothetical protein